MWSVALSITIILNTIHGLSACTRNRNLLVLHCTLHVKGGRSNRAGCMWAVAGAAIFS